MRPKNYRRLIFTAAQMTSSVSYYRSHNVVRPGPPSLRCMTCCCSVVTWVLISLLYDTVCLSCRTSTRLSFSTSTRAFGIFLSTMTTTTLDAWHSLQPFKVNNLLYRLSQCMFVHCECTNIHGACAKSIVFGCLPFQRTSLWSGIRHSVGGPEPDSAGARDPTPKSTEFFSDGLRYKVMGWIKISIVRTRIVWFLLCCWKMTCILRKRLK